jgi:hypothetical protein
VSDRSLEVVDEDLLDSLLGVDGVVAEAPLVMLEPPATSMAVE